MSQGPCGDCKQCQCIERRDGGPTWDELALEGTDPEFLALDQGLDIPGERERITIEAQPIQEVVPDPAQLAREQSEGNGAVATFYKAIQTGTEITREQLEEGNQELKKLWQRVKSMRLNKQGVLEIQVANNEKPR